MLNWRSHPVYDSETVSNVVPDRPGVYVLWTVFAFTGVFYVGKSKELSSRLQRHLEGSEENICLKDKLSCFQCGFSFAEANFYQLDSIERYLYERYKPSCNNQLPEAFALPVNLPI